MRVVVSVAVSADGYIDDASENRLVLSCEEDWDQVRRLRAECDAILIGAGTLRNDNPSLSIKPQSLRDERLQRGESADLIKVVVSGSGSIEPSFRLFSSGDNKKIIFTNSEHKEDLQGRFHDIAEVIAPKTKDETITARFIIDSLADKGVKSLLIEGGAQILNMFLDSGYVEYMRLAVSTKVVGDGVRFLERGAGEFISTYSDRLLSSTQVGDMMVYCYDMRSEDRRLLTKAIQLADRCPASDTAYSVGAIVRTVDGRIFEGYSRMTSPINHAEEEAMNAAMGAGASLVGATIYCSMEPCSQRSSKPDSCSKLIIERGLSKVVFAVAEPENFVRCTGATMLKNSGVEVVVMRDLSDLALAPNRHIVG